MPTNRSTRPNPANSSDALSGFPYDHFTKVTDVADAPERVEVEVIAIGV
jgi:hypothetical protein